MSTKCLRSAPDFTRLLLASGASNLARAALAVALTALVLTHAVSLLALYLVLIGVGIAEVAADTATPALLPSLVDDRQLPRANALLGAAFLVGNQFVGPPLGAWLFIAGHVWPFGLEAAGSALSTVLVAGIAERPADNAVPPTSPASEQAASLWDDVGTGLRWLRTNTTVRTLTVVLAAMNVTFAAAFASWALYVRDRLGVPAGAFGILLTASAVGGLIGPTAAGRLTDRFGAPLLLRAGLLIETAVLTGLAMTTDAWVAGAVMVVFGAHAAVWGAVSTTIRQRLVPDRMRGRVGSAHGLLVMGGSALGTLVGGLLARGAGLAGPFWVAAGVNVVIVAVAWSSLGTLHLIGGAPADPPRDTA